MNFFKKPSIIISSISLIVAIAFGTLYAIEKFDLLSSSDKEEKAAEITAAEGDIVYLNLDEIMEGYDMANDLKSQLQGKADKIAEELQRRERKLQNDYNSFVDKVNRGAITPTVAQSQQAKLQKQGEEFEQFRLEQAQIIQQEELAMLEQIADTIKEFLDKYNEEKKYAMIITNNANTPVITAAPGLDITDDVLTKLNEEYIASKNANKGK